jgi:hypothetical protein
MFGHDGILAVEEGLKKRMSSPTAGNLGGLRCGDIAAWRRRVGQRPEEEGKIQSTDFGLRKARSRLVKAGQTNAECGIARSSKLEVGI